MRLHDQQFLLHANFQLITYQSYEEAFAVGLATYEGPKQKKHPPMLTIIFHAQCLYECMLGKAIKL